MFTVVVENVSVATPVLKPSVPPSVPTRLAVPAGATWKKFKVKFPPIAGPSKLAGTVVVTTISPKLVPAGVFTGFVVPLNVIVVVPLMLVKLTTFVPLMLKTPVVLNVTGSAWAATAENARNAAHNSGIKTFRTLMSIRCPCPPRGAGYQLQINKSALLATRKQLAKRTSAPWQSERSSELAVVDGDGRTRMSVVELRAARGLEKELQTCR